MTGPHSIEFADAIVVGTRCAGSAAAIALAKAGRRVIGLDSSRFPSDALSTHLLWPAGIAELKTLGALDRVRELGAPPLTVAMAVAVGPQYAVRAPYTPYEGIDYAMCVRRTGLDAALVTTAKQAGAEIRERARVTELVWQHGRVSGVRYTDADNVFREIRAPLTIGADGRSSTVAGLVGVRDKPFLHAPSGRNCYYGYWRDTKPEWRDTAVMWRADALLGTAFPCDDGLVLCLLQPPVDQSPRRVTSGVEEFYRSMIEQIPGLNDRLRGCELVGKVRSGLNIASYFRRSAGPGWALAGDAGHFKDPVTAQGIRDALRYGRLLGEATATLLDAPPALDPTAIDTAVLSWEQRRLRECIDVYQWTNRQARGAALTPFELELYRAADANPVVAVGLIEVYSRLRTPNGVVSLARLAQLLARGIAKPATSRRAFTRQLGRELRDAATEWTERRVTLPDLPAPPTQSASNGAAAPVHP
jgi:flavin-dependent dehydrogenase